MKETHYLQELDRLKQEQVEKADYFTKRYEAGTMNKETYDQQMKGVDNSVDIINKETEKEIEAQGLTEQEYLEAKEGWRQEQEQGRDVK